MKNNHIGICHICQKRCNLTYEHIPPYKAFNWYSAKSIEGDEIMKLITDSNRMPWETNGLKYCQKQRGMGMYSLCQNCNNITGSFYGTEYIKFAHTINNLFPKIVEICKRNENNIVEIEIKRMRPLLFAKQVLSMFCSTCQSITKEDKHISDLLLNKDMQGLDSKKYKLSMFLLNQHRIEYTGIQAMFIDTIGIKQIATIDAYPFGFVLEFNPKENISSPELNITSFFNEYENKEYDMHFGFPILERNNIISCDYRTKEEIKNITEENRKYIN